ncbi:hypothetical protein CR152_19065 [Massilia violaceinigra]|uniref:Uncharacterized protein n=1 Tax=Massilia violaceinigra TaxID=2045208 RepID=A0A2D2DN38_9BURK|nr:hypothetical protein [Massilia violaceinigra]ATQ76394.1 hypothetical protein CR152_19065 [Massilia violaceinigra]
MPTFFVLLFSMQFLVLAQRQTGGGRVRSSLRALGLAGLGAGFALSAHVNGVERGAAVWVASLMAAGLMAPLVAIQTARLLAAMQSSRMWMFAMIGQRLQATAK